MVVASIIKFVATFTGLLATLGYTAIGLVKKDKAKIKKAAVIFLMTAALILLISAVEFAFY